MTKTTETITFEETFECNLSSKQKLDLISTYLFQTLCKVDEILIKFKN